MGFNARAWLDTDSGNREAAGRTHRARFERKRAGCVEEDRRLTGFKETTPQMFLDFLKWLGELEVASYR